eukprot:520848-Hanusia_phi.AAC.2
MRYSNAELKSGGEAASRQEPMQLEVRDQWRVSRQNGEDWVLRTDAIAQVVYGQGRLDAVEEALLDGKVKHAADVIKHAEPQDGEKRVVLTLLWSILAEMMLEGCNDKFSSECGKDKGSIRLCNGSGECGEPLSD